MLMRAYFADRGEGEQRARSSSADTAHGTNPASVTMAGYELAQVETDARGNIDVDDLRGKVDEHTAGLMLTNPSTLGLFDENIEEIAEIFHGAGALMYYDGANLNAVCGISRPGDMGFDIVHINLHKTFSQPHGGGGPGGGPIAVRDNARAVPARCRRSCATATAFRLDYDRPKSIGKVRGVHRAVRRLRPLVRVHPRVRPAAPRDVRGRGAERQLPARAAEGRVRPSRSTGSACTSSCSRRAQPEARARRHRARRRQAADGLRLPPADDLLPARSSRRR